MVGIVGMSDESGMSAPIKSVGSPRLKHSFKKNIKNHHFVNNFLCLLSIRVCSVIFPV
jgi:hypothetical protein